MSGVVEGWLAVAVPEILALPDFLKPAMISPDFFLQSFWQFSELISLYKKLDNFLYKISSYLKYLKQFAF